MSDDPKAGLRLFLDSADRTAWATWLPTGLFHGITTNPTILAQSAIPCDLPRITALAAAAFDHGVAELQVQTFGRSTEKLVENGRAIAAIDRRIVVKVPITREGAAAAAILKAEGARITMTAIYAAHQAVSAAALGADYAAPYLGRMNDAGYDGFGAIAAMHNIVTKSGSPTRILVASLRAADDLARLAALGVNTFTFAPKIAEALFGDPLTIAAAEAFEKAAEAG